VFFEDYVVDHVTTSRGRTITESDIVNFAGLSGDFVELHTNEEYAKRGPFGRRIAHGALVFSISTGLTLQMTTHHEGIIAFYGMDRLRFLGPVFIGDTIHVTKRVAEKQMKKDGRGVVKFETTVLNQEDKPVVIYHDLLMVKSRS
jgi:3-hydroxybutyryl-CoA dehydratase